MKKNLIFLEYELDLAKRTLYCKTKTIPLTNLGYEVLLYLAEHSGQVVTRDELINHAWKNKVVSDTTLYKQIQRLREQIGDSSETKRIIQTVHGQGFIFLPEVSYEDQNSTNANPISSFSNNHSKNNYFKKIWMSTLVIVLILFVPLLFKFHQQQAVLVSQASAEPMKLVVLPDLNQLITDDQSWMAYGGMHYLIEKFQNNVQIQITSFTKAQLDETSAEKKAIELTHSKNIDAALILRIREQNNQFLAEATLRNDNGILAHEEFTSIAIKELLDQIHSWSTEKFNLQQGNLVNQVVLSENRHAIENYIRGMAAQLSGQSADAVKYFENAIAEDDRFWIVWYELAIAFRKQAEHNKALSILNTLENTLEDGKFLLKVQNAKSITLWRLGNHELALSTIDHAIESAKLQNHKSINHFLINKAIFAMELGELEIASSAIKEAIDFIEKQQSLDFDSLGSAYNTLAGINQNSHDYELAEVNANKAIKYFTEAKDERYIAVSQSRLSSIYIAQGKLKAALELIKQNLVVQLQLEDISGQISNHLKLTSIFIQTGELSALQLSLNTAGDLLTQTSNQYLKNNYLATLIHQLLLKQEYDQAAHYLKQMEGQHINDDQLLAYRLLKLEYFLTTNNLLEFDTTFLQFNKDPPFSGHPMSFYWQAKRAEIEHNNPRAISAMKNALLGIDNKSHDRIQQILILNFYTQLLISENIVEAVNLSNKCESLNPPPFPFLKIKAAIKAQQNEYFEAAALMQELKILANDYWQPDQQLLLESYESQVY